MVNNNRGALTLDFVFALILVTGLSGMLLALSLTLVMVEVSQYIAFSTSRVYFSGGKDIETQTEQSKEKFKQLTGIKVFKTLFSNGWFELHDNPQRDFRDEYPETSADKSTFVGVKLQFVAKMLDFKVPGFGSTGGDGKGFKANVTSYLGREPTFQECSKFMIDRYSEILKLNSSWSEFARPNEYVPATDNGC